MKQVFYVYIIFRSNGVPCYVGKGQGNRWKDHFKLGAKHYNKHLGRIIVNADGNLPVCIVRDNLTETDAHITEMAFIAAIGRGRNGLLVNLTNGGEGIVGYHHTLKSRKKMGLGQPKSPESVAAMAVAARKVWASKSAEERTAWLAACGAGLLGKSLSKAHREAIGRGNRNSPINYIRAKNIGLALKGKAKSPAHRVALSLSRTGRKFGSYSEAHKAAIRAGQLAAWARRREKAES